MSTRFSAAPLVALAFVFCSPASAEVVMTPAFAGARFEVTPVEGSIWRVDGPVTERHLNPMGDSFGDGVPSHAVSSGALLVAWGRPAMGHVQAAVVPAGGARWHATQAITAPGVFGQPRVLAREDGWLVVLNQAAGSPEVVMAGITREGRATAPTPLRGGLLVEVVAVGDMVHAITLDPVNLTTGRYGLDATSFRPNYSIPEIPIPIIDGRSVDLHEFNAPILPLPPIEQAPRPGLTSRSSSRRLPPVVRTEALLSPDIRVHSGTDGDRETYAVVTWWVDAYSILFVELTEDGAQLPPERVSSLMPNDPYLVQEAVRAVRDR